MSIRNDRLYEDLRKFGLKRRKSLTLKFSTHIKDQHLSHFIRGYFDGDGCISRYIDKTFPKKW